MSGPGPFVLPEAWQPAALQKLCTVGFTFVVNDFGTELQSSVPPPPPDEPPPVVLLPLLQEIMNRVQVEARNRINKNAFMIRVL